MWYVVAAKMDMVKANPASFHVGAYYLTGAPRANFEDSEQDLFLGRLGTFARVNFKSASLCKSPHLTDHKVQGYGDYDPTFRDQLNGLKTSKDQSSTGLVSLVAGTQRATNSSVFQRLFEHTGKAATPSVQWNVCRKYV